MEQNKTHRLCLLLDQRDAIIIDSAVKIKVTEVKAGKNGGRPKVRLVFESETEIPIWRESYLLKLAARGLNGKEEIEKIKEAKNGRARPKGNRTNKNGPKKSLVVVASPTVVRRPRKT